ncbi:unnamed protein product [Auanema sp. JU1783]|nr:unnamed protein product [Auanema sp. JU1783]
MELHRAKDFRTYFLAIIPVVLSVIAFILNAIYTIIQIKAYRTESSGYRKRYCFLLSRSLSTLMALILLYIVIIVWKSGGFQYATAMIFMFVGCLSFLSIAGTYIALSCLLYTAIVHPIVYKVDVTLRYCYYCVIGVWVFSLAASVCVGLWGATLFYPDSSPVKCSFRSCQKPLSIVIVISLAIWFSSVQIIYAFLWVRLRNRHNKATIERQSTVISSDSHVSSSLRAMNRLSLNMITFAVGSVPILIVCIVALANLKKLSSLGEGKKSHCKTYLNSCLFIQVEILASIAAIVWLLAMILDPIINTTADRKLIAILASWWKSVKKLLCAKDQTDSAIVSTSSS